MDLNFTVTNQIIKRVDTNAIISGSKNYLYAAFTFSSEWSTIIKTAQFKKGSLIIDMLLINDRCIIPWEMLAKAGKISVTVFGGNLITVNSEQFYVTETGMSLSNTPAQQPSPSYYQQVINALGSPGPAGQAGPPGPAGPAGPAGVNGSAVPIDDASTAADRVLSAQYIKAQLAEKANKMQEAWITPTLLNSWFTDPLTDTNGLGYMKDDMSLCTIMGSVRNGITTINTVLFTLPPGYRPIRILRRVPIREAGGNASINIETNGDVVLGSNIINNIWVSINLVFKVV